MKLTKRNRIESNRIDANQQIQTVIQALDSSVVELIQDLNGNHVIQRCLNKLSSEDKQFVYDAVTNNCIEVATHRHGCCVLQRCIDFSTDAQKVNLLNLSLTFFFLSLLLSK